MLNVNKEDKSFFRNKTKLSDIPSEIEEGK